MHRRSASVGIFGGAFGKAFTRQKRRRRCRAAPRSRDSGQMKAMILAAGLGTRLRPLTDHRPKALVEIAGRTLLEITLSRLSAFGIHDVIVNVHHFADMVVDYLNAKGNFGMRVEISREEILLETGGGLKHTAWFLGDSDPFVLHNVDVI